jgi:hypothetical protein
MKKFYEETLEDIIFENSKSIEKREILKQCGLEIKGKLLRQVTIGGYGRADLMSVYINGKRNGKHRVYVTIYELKKDCIGRKVVFQAAKYVYGLKRYFEKSKFFKNFSIEVKAVIIGSTIESDSYYEFITSICPSLELYTYNYRISGLTFEKVTLNEKECTFGSMDEIFSSFGRNDLRDICGYMFPDFPF